MSQITAESSVKRYLEGTQSGAARARYLEGIEAVTESPMEKAAAADQLYLRRVQESVESGRRAARLRETPMSVWKEGAKRKGADRLASGAAAAVEKIRRHFQKWTPIYQEVSREVSTMPKGSTEDSIARVAHVIRRLKTAAGKA